MRGGKGMERGGGGQIGAAPQRGRRDNAAKIRQHITACHKQSPYSVSHSARGHAAPRGKAAARGGCV